MYMQTALVERIPEFLRLEELHEQPILMREPGSTTRLALERVLKQAGVTLRVAMGSAAAKRCAKRWRAVWAWAAAPDGVTVSRRQTQRFGSS